MPLMVEARRTANAAASKLTMRIIAPGENPIAGWTNFAQPLSTPTRRSGCPANATCTPFAA